MTENTAPAQCSEAEYNMARDAGLFVATTADERAIHAFAQAIRAPLLDALSELADLMDDVRSGNYTPDSFTTQPARTAIREATES